MGCGRSRIYHENEVGTDHKQLVMTPFKMQDADIIHDLDTDNDQKGRVAVDCIFRPTREIYGQKAEDMVGKNIVWSNYGIAFLNRPFPHDFPAFAHEKPAVELAQLHRLSAEWAGRHTNRLISLKNSTETKDEVVDVDIDG